MKNVRGIAREKRDDVAGGDPRRRIVLSHRAFGPDRFVVKDNRRQLTATSAIVGCRKRPWTQHRPRRTLRAESTFIMQRHRISARLRVRGACSTFRRRAERHQYGGLLVEARSKASQFCDPFGSTKSVLPRFVCDFEREDLVLAAARHCRKSID